ncbi:MAG: branched-chain amino acid transaminase [SAR202 cluster bacterium]|nr:branched-chain amino acid transaminase [SAR202 cluster bacterium]
MTQSKGKQAPRNGQPNPHFLWRSGQIVPWEQATVHVTSVGWTAVGAVFEGIRGYWSASRRELFAFQLDAHMTRLARSMKLMRMATNITAAQVRQGVLELLSANEFREDVYVQPLVYFAEGIPGYVGVVERPVDVLITARPSPSTLEEDGGLTACVSSWARIADNVMPPRVKALANYQNSRLVSTEARVNGYDQAIVLNREGKVTEAASSCIVIVRDGVATSPPWSAGTLESITREALFTLARNGLGMRVEERDVDRTELYIADEVLLCGTLMEVKPVLSVDRYTVGDGRPGPVTRKLQELYLRVARGEAPAYGNWLTPVHRGRRAGSNGAERAAAVNGARRAGTTKARA